LETDISARDRLSKEGYKLLEVPKILYDELSAAFGTGEETRVRVTGIPHGTYLVRAIAITHPEAAFTGAIGVEVNEYLERSTLAIWHRRPTPDDEDSVGAPYAYLSLFASARETGVWTAVRGNHMADALTAELTYHGPGPPLPVGAVRVACADARVAARTGPRMRRPRLLGRLHVRRLTPPLAVF
jgi:hypothetical protein